MQWRNGAKQIHLLNGVIANSNGVNLSLAVESMHRLGGFLDRD
jgi:hypothetical protein